MDVLVIGAGAIGSCAALRLAQAGAEVTLVSHDEPADTLSAHSFGWANAIDEGSAAYFDLSVEALAAHERLAADVAGPERWLFGGGNLHWGRDRAGADAQRAIADGYRELGYPVEEMTPAEVLRDLEPGLRLEDVVGPVYFYPRDVHVLGDVMLAAVLAEAEAAGVRVRIGEQVTEVLRGPTGVRLASGETITADAVVCCAGRGNALLVPGLPLLEPGSPERLTRGFLFRTGPLAETVTRIVHAPGLSIRPHTGDRLVLHCHDLDRTPPDECDADVFTEEVRARLAEVLPGAKAAEVVLDFFAVRPVPRDGMSIIGPVPGRDGVFVIATHSGVTLAPVLGEIAAREVLGTPHPLAERFRLDRFTTS